jgi:molybdate transport system substrate-binding protein
VSRRRALVSVPVAALVALAVAACGGSSGTPELKVSAAASLKKAFTQYGQSFGHVTFSFAGSDQLAAQIRAGARPGVFASANTKLPASLFASGLVDKPVPFATNRLVLAVPTNSSKVTSLADLTKPGVTIAIGDSTVPVGVYTATVLGRIAPSEARAIKHNIRSQEPSVDGIVGKLTTGAVDAGFLYITDVKAAGGSVKAIPLPASLQPTVVYGGAAVKGSGQESRARQFISGLLGGSGRAALAAAGFGPPPS